MTTPDSTTELQRLAQRYAAMSDGELQRVAEDAGSLTELAVQALAAEVQRRGLNLSIADAAVPLDEVKQRELVTIRQFRDMPEALLARGALEAAGIECFLADENMVRMNWFVSNLVGGIKLRVNGEDAERASALLDEPIPESFEVEGVGTYEQPRCPNCGSIDIKVEAGFEKGLALPALYIAGIPVPVKRDRWKCESCHREWQEIDSDEAPDET